MIGAAVAAALLLILVLLLAYLGAFSRPSAEPRNQAMEQAVAEDAEADLQSAFGEESGFTLVRAEVTAMLYLSEYPAETEITEKLLRRIITEKSERLVAELVFAGDRLDFTAYKNFAADAVIHFRTELNWTPSALQIFYRRYPEAGESEAVDAYESQIPGYLFTKDKDTIVNSTGTHYIIELSPELEKKTKAYIVVRILNFVVISGTVVGLSALWIVRKCKKTKKRKAAEKENET